MDSRRTDLFGRASAAGPISTSTTPLQRHAGLNADAVSNGPPLEASSGAVADAPATDPKGIGQLRYLEPRELWPGGESELLLWLAQHPEPLAVATGLTLRPLTTSVELPVESLILQTEAGDAVVVVVDLGESSDNTLGRLMRTVAASSAKASIWAAGAPRDEHLASMSWLNRTVAERSFIVQLRAVQIDDSRPAPIFAAMLRPPRRGDPIPGAQPAEKSPDAEPGPDVEVRRRADDWPSVSLIERGADQPD